MLELGTWRGWQAFEIAVVGNGAEKAAEIENHKNIMSPLLTFMWFPPASQKQKQRRQMFGLNQRSELQYNTEQTLGNFHLWPWWTNRDWICPYTLNNYTSRQNTWNNNFRWLITDSSEQPSLRKRNKLGERPRVVQANRPQILSRSQHKRKPSQSTEVRLNSLHRFVWKDGTQRMKLHPESSRDQLRFSAVETGKEV